MFGRKAVPPDPRSLPESWSVSKGTYQGNVMVTRFNRGLKPAAGNSALIIQIGVAIPLKAPDGNGLPGREESEQLTEIEDELVRLAGDRALLAGVITTGGMREFVLYTATSDWIAGFHEQLQERTKHHDVQVMAKTDPKWETYKAFGG